VLICGLKMTCAEKPSTADLESGQVPFGEIRKWSRLSKMVEKHGQVRVDHIELTLVGKQEGQGVPATQSSDQQQKKRRGEEGYSGAGAGNLET